MEKHKATLEDKRIAQEFRRFVYERPLNGIFTLWNLQGALRFANHGISSEQEYVLHLKTAVEAGFIEPVSRSADTYKRIPFQSQKKRKSSSAWQQTQEIKDRVISALESWDWLY